jgi:hypothetical protein
VCVLMGGWVVLCRCVGGGGAGHERA